jgi:hypothetical protein
MTCSGRLFYTMRTSYKCCTVLRVNIVYMRVIVLWNVAMMLMTGTHSDLSRLCLNHTSRPRLRNLLQPQRVFET